MAGFVMIICIIFVTGEAFRHMKDGEETQLVAAIAFAGKVAILFLVAVQGGLLLFSILIAALWKWCVVGVAEWCNTWWPIDVASNATELGTSSTMT